MKCSGFLAFLDVTLFPLTLPTTGNFSVEIPKTVKIAFHHHNRSSCHAAPKTWGEPILAACLS
jgi:hypothetical protein